VLFLYYKSVFARFLSRTTGSPVGLRVVKLQVAGSIPTAAPLFFERARLRMKMEKKGWIAISISGMSEIDRCAQRERSFAS
jgi:hypothetical protein